MKHLLKIIALIISIFTILSVSAQDEHHGEHETDTTKFNVGEFIFDHVGDSYDWHILTVGETHVSIPLPIILISKNSGFHIFFSSKFEHGHHNHKGFIIAQEGDNKGKIVEILPDGTEKKPIDLSITKLVFSLFFSITLILIIFLSVAKTYKKNPHSAPKGLQSWLEPLIVFVRDDIAKASINKKNYEKFTPFLLTIFFFIFINNLLGLIPIFPGGANLTGNIAITMVLALFTFFITTFRGNKNYYAHIFWTPGVPWWLKLPLPLMPFIELIGVFTKPFVLMVRLFANISAGHMVAIGFVSIIFVFSNLHPAAGGAISIVSVLLTVFMTFLELLVAFIQAYVFTLLSAIYFGMATEEHH